MLEQTPQINNLLGQIGLLSAPEPSSLTKNSGEFNRDFAKQLHTLLIGDGAAADQSVDELFDLQDLTTRDALSKIPFDMDLESDKDLFSQLSDWLAEQGMVASALTPKSLLAEHEITTNPDLDLLQKNEQRYFESELADNTDIAEVSLITQATDQQVNVDAQGLVTTQLELEMSSDVSEVKESDTTTVLNHLSVLEESVDSKNRTEQPVDSALQSIVAKTHKADVKPHSVDADLIDGHLNQNSETINVKTGSINERTESLAEFHNETEQDKLQLNTLNESQVEIRLENTDEPVVKNPLEADQEIVEERLDQPVALDQDSTRMVDSMGVPIAAGTTNQVDLTVGAKIDHSASLNVTDSVEEDVVEDELDETESPLMMAMNSGSTSGQSSFTAPNSNVASMASQMATNPRQAQAQVNNSQAKTASESLSAASPSESAQPAAKTVQELVSQYVSQSQAQTQNPAQPPLQNLGQRELLAQQQQEVLRQSDAKQSTASDADDDRLDPLMTFNPAERKSVLPSLASIQYPMRHPQWSHALSKRIVFMANNQLQQAQISLNPEKLGPIQIRLQVDRDQMVTVSMTAQHGATREALEQAIPRLKEMLEEAGIRFDKVNVDEESVFEQAADQQGFGKGQDGSQSPGLVKADDSEEQDTKTKILETDNTIDFYV